VTITVSLVTLGLPHFGQPSVK